VDAGEALKNYVRKPKKGEDPEFDKKIGPHGPKGWFKKEATSERH
jgi:hypothetical protein